MAIEAMAKTLDKLLSEGRIDQLYYEERLEQAVLAYSPAKGAVADTGDAAIRRPTTPP